MGRNIAGFPNRKILWQKEYGHTSINPGDHLCADIGTVENEVSKFGLIPLFLPRAIGGRSRWERVSWDEEP